MASTWAPRRWQMPSTRKSTPGASETSSASRVTDEGATPGGSSSMGKRPFCPRCDRHARYPPLDVPVRDDKGPRWSSAGLANNDGDAGGAERHERCGERLHCPQAYTLFLDLRPRHGLQRER